MHGGLSAVAGGRHDRRREMMRTPVTAEQRGLGRLLGDAARRRRAEASGHMHLQICFGPNGRTDFFPEGHDREELARQLMKIVNLLHGKPRLIRCAAGACDATCGHADLGTPS